MSNKYIRETRTRPTYTTEQEKFWAGEFGNEYITRNQGEQLIRSNEVAFRRILSSAPKIRSIVEVGCNIGLNLQSLYRINKDFDLCGYELNEVAAQKASELKVATIIHNTILDDISITKKFDLSFTKGVLIHINPEELTKVYRNLYDLSKQYILIFEYYNPTPVMVPYRGYANRLFKRDFAGELIDKFSLRLVDYGFIYHRDNHFPLGDLNWFLLEK